MKLKNLALVALAALGLVSVAQVSEARLGHRAALSRYFSPERADHWITTGTPNDWTYDYESTFGYVLLDPAPGYRPIYECLVNGRDHMISLRRSCEYQQYLGLAGFIRQSPAPGAIMIRRCYTWDGQSHFVSTDVNCEGQRAEGVLGYIDQY